MSTSNNSLIKKTKTELVNIILKKDEKEKELLSQISIDKTKDTDILQLKDKINKLKDELDNKKITNERLGATIVSCEQNIEDLNNRLNAQESELRKAHKDIYDFEKEIEDYQKGCDNCVTQTQIKVENLYRYKCYSLIVTILFIIAMVKIVFF